MSFHGIKYRMYTLSCITMYTHFLIALWNKRIESVYFLSEKGRSEKEAKIIIISIYTQSRCD